MNTKWQGLWAQERQGFYAGQVIKKGMNGWELNLRAKGWHGSAKIMYCPMCGRRLERG